MAGYFDTESSKEGRKERERERRLDDVDQSLLPNRAATPDLTLLGNQSQRTRQAKRVLRIIFVHSIPSSTIFRPP
jgi:hypothetical protein